MSSPPHPRRRLAPTTALLLMGAFFLVALGTPAMAVPSACTDEDTSDDCNNNGTVKVHTAEDSGSMENDPHVDCPFYVEGFNMDATSGTLVVKSWPPTGDRSVVINDTWEADGESTADSNHFENGPYSLPSGHYKLFVSDTQHDKMKVFWVDCEEAPTETPTETGTTTGGPTTEIPFFPSTAALLVGVGGAVLGSVLMLRRRL